MHETGVSGGGPLVIADNENISHSNGSEDGWWRQCLFVRNGKRVPANWRHHQQQQQRSSGTSTSVPHWPVATALFERLLAPLDDHDGASSSSSSFGVAERLPKGSIEYSMLGPGAHLKPHCGPSNHRLRIHLPIVLPATIQENEQVRMIVAGDGDPPGPTATATATGSECVAVARSRPGVVDCSNTSRAWVAGRATIFDDSYEVHNSIV